MNKYELERLRLLNEIGKWELILRNMNPESSKYQSMKDMIARLNYFIKIVDSTIYELSCKNEPLESKFRGIGSELKRNFNRL